MSIAIVLLMFVLVGSAISYMAYESRDVASKAFLAFVVAITWLVLLLLAIQTITTSAR